MSNNLSSYPTSIDVLSTRTAFSVNESNIVFGRLGLLADAIMALQRKVGTTSSTDTSSLDYLINNLSSGSGLTHPQTMVRVSLRF